MGLRGYAVFIAFAVAGLALPDIASAEQAPGWTPYTATLLRSNKEEEMINDIEWRSGTFPVYILPIEGGSQPVVRIEATLVHRDWAIFWNNNLIKPSEKAEAFLTLEVPLQGEYTPVELFGTRNVVQLEREVVMLHFPKWKETRTVLDKKDPYDNPGRLGTRLTAALGADVYSQSTALSTSVAARLQAHTGLGKKGRFRLGMAAWISAAEISKQQTTSAILRREIDVLAGYTLGSRFRITPLIGMSSLTLSLTELGGGATVAGPMFMPVIELPLGSFVFSLIPRAAYYDSLPGSQNAFIEVGAQLHFQFGPREKGSIALILEARALDSTSSDILITGFGGIGYSL